MAAALYDLIRLNLAIYPGVVSYRSASFLHPYYEHCVRPGRLATLVNAVVYAGFQMWLPLRARLVARRWGKDAAWEKRAVAIARARFVDPNDIALFRIEDEAELDHYMRRFEHIGVGRAIANDTTDHSPLLQDKELFYALCKAHGIPHPQVFAIYEDGDVRVHSLPERGQEVFLKPAHGTGGKGAAVAVFEPDTWLIAELRNLVVGAASRPHGRWLVQQRLLAEPSLRPLSPRALPTVRVVTLLDERDQPEIVSTVLRMAATGDQVVDNIGVGGLSAPVDPESGAIGHGCGGMAPGEFARHPLTGAQIEGRQVPFWDEIKQLALTTHANHFGDHVMIGWDVGVAEGGPVLLEANPRPSIIMTQRAARVPVGKTRMGALIEHHLQRRAGGHRASRRLLVG